MVVSVVITIIRIIITTIIVTKSKSKAYVPVRSVTIGYRTTPVTMSPVWSIPIWVIPWVIKSSIIKRKVLISPSISPWGIKAIIINVYGIAIRIIPPGSVSAYIGYIATNIIVIFIPVIRSIAFDIGKNITFKDFSNHFRLLGEKILIIVTVVIRLNLCSLWLFLFPDSRSGLSIDSISLITGILI